MYGNEVLPRIFSETAFADDFCFIQGHWLFLFMETGESPVRLRKGTFRRFFLLEMEKEAGKGGKSPCHIVEKGGKRS